MPNAGLNPHEMLELHEILGSKVTEAKKIQANKAIVTDSDLANFMESVLSLKKAELEDLQNIIGPTTVQ